MNTARAIAGAMGANFIIVVIILFFLWERAEACGGRKKKVRAEGRETSKKY